MKNVYFITAGGSYRTIGKQTRKPTKKQIIEKGGTSYVRKSYENNELLTIDWYRIIEGKLVHVLHRNVY